ncbi:hypothetical protein [Enterococcus pallens]|uniref:Uncharacterized protein n=1 Tax=Enterococcus pallens ATCC BAA-351 TaxID=1158607 RepID=R2QIB9_9ENTE|nr:hypothetical protein [Enterococcus pallens]EOH94923.1 hypothetical protein UAU_01845 [Enterococcus pallens ATCC BAA-351]EOU14758.1 hypothetical protein I588_04408 [Enterococcus pallens ATCC BAA-351]OJG76247.1 hypothetical protein RV10_GL004093 [Enterococcus pallens]
MSKEKETTTQRKSNKSVKTAVLLFGAVLLTTSLLGGTLAKYTGTIGEASDSARVARWGLTEETQELDMFDTAYLNDEQQTTVKNVTDPSDGQNVIAPGTKGEVLVLPSISEAKLKNVEAAFEVSYAYGEYAGDNVFGKYLGNWNDAEDGTSGDNWLPLRFSVYKYNAAEAGADKYTTKIYDGVVEKGSSASTESAVDNGIAQLNGLNDAIKNAASSETIYPGDSLTTKQDKLARMGLKIVWEWPFERANVTLIPVDKNDTVVGNRAASIATDHVDMPRFKMSMKYTVVQVD